MKISRRTLIIGLGILLVSLLNIVPIKINAAEDLATASITDFDVFDADIRDVMRGLAELGDINVLFDPAVKGTITIKLKHGLTIKEAIELICQTHGYSYRWIAGSRSVIIGNEKTFASFEVTDTRVYQLHYAKVDDISRSLGVIIDSKKVSTDTRSNQLTVRASILEHQNIEEVIKNLDREMPQINIEARVEELTQSASKDLGINWSFAGPTANKSVLSSEVDFKVVSIATLTALESSNKARLLASPNISTTDSQEGRIFIGEKYPIISTSTVEGTTTTTVTYIEFGTNLSVTPRINESDTVTVNIKAYVSSATEWKAAADGSQVPVIKTREATSVVRLREGETFVLSGLNMRKSSFDKAGLPGLSKVPILGRLFGRRTDRAYDDSEICIFVTPKIIKSTPRPTPVSPTSPVSNQASVTLEPPQPESTPTTTPPVVSSTEPVKEATPQVIEVTPSATTTEPTTTAVTTPVTATTQPGAEVNTTTGTAPVTTTEPVAPTVPTTTASTATTAVTTDGTPSSAPPPEATVKPVITEPMFGLKITLRIKAGDTINLIAKKYGITPESILNENKLKANEILKVGQALVVPIPQNHLYQVKPKETLWRIAKRYGTTVALLQELNKVTDVTKLEVGQTIILPVAVDQIVDKNY